MIDDPEAYVVRSEEEAEKLQADTTCCSNGRSLRVAYSR